MVESACLCTLTADPNHRQQPCEYYYDWVCIQHEMVMVLQVTCSETVKLLQEKQIDQVPILTDAG